MSSEQEDHLLSALLLFIMHLPVKTLDQLLSCTPWFWT